jgi:hypothetical protein
MVKTLNVPLDEADQALLSKQKGKQSWTEYLLSMNTNFNSIHNNIHGLRMVAGYKPTNFELNINKMICEMFKDTCKECSDRLKKIEVNGIDTKKTFLGRLFDGSSD